MQYPILAILVVALGACRLGFEFPGAGAGDAAGDSLDAASADDAAVDAAVDAALDAALFDAPAGQIDASAPLGLCDPGIPDLVACYRFDNSGVDESGAGNDLTLAGVSFVTGMEGMALSTRDGSMAIAAAHPSLIAADALTVEMWVNPRSLPASNRMGLLDHDNQYSIFLYPGQIRCGGLDYVILDYTLPTSTWTHIAFTNDASAQKIWINGVEAIAGPTALLGTEGTAGMGIGQNAPMDNNFLGAIDNLRVFTSVRSAGEICAAAAPNCP